MADTGIFCTGEDVSRKAGSGCFLSTSETATNHFITEAESFINVATRRNWSDNYSGLDVDKKGLLREVASNLAAIYVLNYNFDEVPGGRIIAEDRANVLRDAALRGISILRDDKAKDFLEDA